MPTCRRKRVLLIEPSPELLLTAQQDATKEVFLLHQTGEIFETYEYVPFPTFVCPTFLTYVHCPPEHTQLG